MPAFFAPLSFFIAFLLCLIVKRKGVIELITALASLAAIFHAGAIALRVAADGIYAPNAFVSVDPLSAIILCTVAVVGLATAFYSIAYLREEMANHIIGLHRVRQYFILFNLFSAAMFLAIVINSPILAWVAIEATTLSTAFLISFYNKPSATEAAWKYLLINSVGLLCGFFGILLYFAALQNATGSVEFISWTALNESVLLNPVLAKIAFIFVLVGYGTKVGFAPMHTWKPDAYSKAPSPLGALFSGALLPVAILMVLRFKTITDAAVGSDFSSSLLIIFGTLSIVTASLIILTAKNYKRLLAYSSIEQAGFMALGFGFGGLGAAAAILHLIYHSFIKAALFFLSGNTLLRYHSSKIIKVTGMLSVLPVTSILFLVGFFAVAGLPPFGLFFTKMSILAAGMRRHPIITGIVIVNLVLLFIGFFKHVTAMVFGDEPLGIKTGEKNIWLIIPPLFLLSLALLISFHLPQLLQTLLSAAVM